jgi:hypothetical protein
VPDKRQHRGAHPEDYALFDPEAWPRLRAAAADLSWLLSRGYSSQSGLKLVGERHNLAERQRMAVLRSACSDDAFARRRGHEARARSVAPLRGQAVLIDGFNVLTTVEAALSGGVILLGRDGCYRDIASMHGTFHKVTETIPAITLIAESLAALEVSECLWYLDRRVSNSGRLKKMILEAVPARNLTYSFPLWRVESVTNVDAILAQSSDVVATADSEILDQCRHWFSLAREVVSRFVPGAHVIDLSYTSA